MSNFLRINKSSGLNSRELRKILLYIILFIFALTTFYPLFWMFYSSFKSNQEIMKNTFSFPKAIHFENYIYAWKTAKIGIYFFNSIIIAIVSVIATIFIGSSAAFILSKFKFRLKKFIYSFFIIGLLIPIQSVLVPLFIQMRGLHLLDNRLSLVIAYTAFGLPLAIFILESFIRAFPDSIMEAALMDGCPVSQIFFKIILPMSNPAIATVSILTFLNNWKEFAFALIFISNDSKKTLPLGLYNFIGAHMVEYAQLMAGMMISSIPIIIMYLILQEQIIKGMTQGAVKG